MWSTIRKEPSTPGREYFADGSYRARELGEVQVREVSGAPTLPVTVVRSASTANEFGLKRFARTLSTRREILVASLALSLATSGLYLWVVPARYIATASVQLDPLRLPRQEVVTSAPPFDVYSVETQAQLLRTDAIASRVVERLGLADLIAITADNATIRLNSLSAFWNRIVGEPKTNLVQTAIATVKNNLSIRRVGLTYVLEVSYNSVDPERAATIANAYVEEYITDRVQQRIDNAAWLKAQLSEVKNRAESAEQALMDFKAENNSKSAAGYRTQLKGLEAYAESYRTLHDGLLRRYAEISQHPEADARVLDKAHLPRRKSSPRSVLVVAFAAVFGLFSGISAALLFDLFAGFRSVRDVETVLGRLAFGVLPRVRRRHRPEPTIAIERSSSIASSLQGVGRLVVDEPDSPAAETLRAACIAMDRRRRVHGAIIVGVTSALAGEGRSTVCSNLARMIAASGSSVLVIDADRDCSDLPAASMSKPFPGLIEVLLGEIALMDAVWRDTSSNVSILPVGSLGDTDERPSRTLDMASLVISPRMADVMREASANFQYVLVRLQPLTKSCDAVSAVDWADSFLLVVEWQKTSRDAVREALERSNDVANKILGVILNKVDPSYLRRTGVAVAPARAAQDRGRRLTVPSRGYGRPWFGRRRIFQWTRQPAE